MGRVRAKAQPNPPWRQGQTLGLDTSVFIYYFERPAEFPLLLALFSHLGEGRISAVASAVVLTELYPVPLKQANRELLNRYREFFALAEPHLTLEPVTRATAERAAQLRARYQLTTPDSLHLATAIECHADFFLTNDVQLKRVKEVSVVCLSDFV